MPGKNEMYLSINNSKYFVNCQSLIATKITVGVRSLWVSVDHGSTPGDFSIQFLIKPQCLFYRSSLNKTQIKPRRNVFFQTRASVVFFFLWKLHGCFISRRQEYLTQKNQGRCHNAGGLGISL